MSKIRISRQLRPTLSALPVFIFILAWSLGYAAPENPLIHNPAGSPSKTGTVSGQFVVQGGGSMAGGQILLYRAGDGSAPSLSRYISIPDLIFNIDPDGSFSAAVPVGNYYLGAIKRNSGQSFGRPRAGDLTFRYYKLDSLELMEFWVNEGDCVDFGKLEARPWKPKEKELFEKTAIEGKLSGPDGKPIENGLVFAFSTPQMRGSRPKFISDPTGRDGRYTLHVAGDKTYYLMARDVMGGGQVAEGGIMGIFGGPDRPIGVSIKSGVKIMGIDIRADRMHRGPMPEKDGEGTIDPRKKEPQVQFPSGGQ